MATSASKWIQITIWRVLALSALLSALSISSAHATETTDLGQNLSYLRVSELADVSDSVTAVIQENRALILDLRYSTASDDGAAHLAHALAARKGPAPLFILVAPGTPYSLVAALEKLPPGAVTLGVKEANPTPRVIVSQSAEVDRRAHAALESGLPIAALINGKIQKERYDEASLVRDFSSGNRNGRPVVRIPDADSADPEIFGNPGVDDDLEPPRPAPVLVDRVLQRAVNLHRATLALRAR